MPEEICNVLNGLRKSIDPTIQEEIDTLFKNLISVCSTTEIDCANEISKVDLLLAILYSNSSCKLEDIKVFLNKYPELLNVKTLEEILILTCLYEGEPTIKDLIDSCVKKGLMSSLKSAWDLGPIIDSINIDFIEVIHFINFLKTKKDYISDIEKLGISVPIPTIKLLVEFLRIRDIINDINNKKESFFKYSAKKIGITKTLPKSHIEKASSSLKHHISALYNYLITAYNTIQKEFNKTKREAKQNNDRIDYLYQILDTDSEIKGLEPILNLEASDTEKGILLDYVINHNRQIYEALIEEYETAKRNSDGNLSQLFNSYGFIYASLDSENQSAIKTMKYEQIEKLLIRLNALGLTRIIVPKVDFRKLDEIETQVSRGILNRTWLSENPEILYKENNLFDIVFRNLDALSKDGVNIFQYLDYLDVLKSPLVSNNLNIIATYGLKITKLTHDISFLASESLRKKIEFLYSLGLFQSMESLDILNGSMADCYRLKIANTINVSPSRITVDINNLLCDFSSTVIPESIQKCLRSEEEIIIPLPLELERFQIDNQTLNIMGVFASSEKVKRNLGKIGDTSADACFYAIIYEGYYTLEEITILRSALVPRNDEEKIVRS